MTTLTPKGKRLLLRPIFIAPTTAGGIVLPDQAQKCENRGTVVAVGPKCEEDWVVGQTVHYPDFAILPLAGSKDGLVSITEDQILAVETETADA